MPQFILLLHETPSDLGQYSPEEMQQIIARYQTWKEGLVAQKRLAGGHKLTEEGGRLLAREGGKVRVTDGPYSEAKEVIGGLFVIEAADYAEAATVSSSCPHLDFGRIELRQVDNLGG